MPTFETAAPIELSIDIPVANVHLVASDRHDTVVTLRPTMRARPQDVRAADQVRVTNTDGRVRVAVPKGWSYYSPFGPSGSVDIDIELPAGSSVDSEWPVGSLGAEGRLGDCVLKSSTGTITLEETGSLSFRTSTGTVSVEHATGNVDLISSTGSIRVARIDGDATIKNSTGNTTVGAVGGQLVVNGAHGSVSIERAENSVQVTTAYGNVRIDEVIRGAVQLESSYGELEIGIRPAVAVWLDVSSQHGSVRTSLTQKDAPAETGDSVEIRARSTHGDIIIRRSNQKSNEARSSSR